MAIVPFAALTGDVPARVGAKSAALLATELRNTEAFEVVEAKRAAGAEPAQAELEGARQRVAEAVELRKARKFRLAEEALQKALASSRAAAGRLEDAGELELEQAYVDFLLSRSFNIRAGMMLVPMGIINERHEPPVFNGVERPFVDTVIIPTTWFEVGAGVHGEVGRGLRYRALVVAPLDATLHRLAAEVRALRWFTWDELATLDLDPGLRRALRAARALTTPSRTTRSEEASDR